jgi:hypothetical protein
MHWLLRRVRFGIAAAVLLVGALPAHAGPAYQTPPRQPAGQTAQNVSLDCDIFADGVHEVPILVVTGPPPGATLAPDNLVIQGAAVDCHVDIGAGINRVSVFLGRREAGGIFLGDAVLKAPTPIPILPADQYAAASGFVLRGQAPLKPGAVNELYVYARSELTNIETAVMLPVVGAGLAPAPAPPAPPPSERRPAPASAPEPTPTQEPAFEPEEVPVEEPPPEEMVPVEEEAPPTE